MERVTNASDQPLTPENSAVATSPTGGNVSKLQRIRPKPKVENGEESKPEEVSEDRRLFPERYINLLDGSHVVIKPWSYLEGREMMNEVLAGFVSKYNLLDPQGPAFQVFEVAQDDLIRMVQLHSGWTDETIQTMPYEDVLAIAEGIWSVNAAPALAKSFRLVASLIALVPRQISDDDSPKPSSSSSPRDIHSAT